MRNPGNHITSKHELDLFHQFSTKPNHITGCFIECIGSMYGIFTYIYHKNPPNAVKYTIHGSYGECIFIFNSLTCCLKHPSTTAQFSNPKLRFPTSMDSRPHGLLSSEMGVYNHRKDHRRKITWRWIKKYLKRQDENNTFKKKHSWMGRHEWFASGWLAFLCHSQRDLWQWLNLSNCMFFVQSNRHSQCQGPVTVF